MTGRERMNAVLRKQPTDRLAWTTLVDNNTLAGLPAPLQGNGGIDFYRHLECDIFMLNGWNTPHAFHSPELQWGDGVVINNRPSGNRVVSEWVTPAGTLTGVTERGHPIKYPVDSLEAVTVYRRMWENARFIAHDDSSALDSINDLLGDDGVVTRFWGPSTIPRLLEQDMGTANFYYLLHDHPQAVDALIKTIHECEKTAFDILAGGPCDSVTLIENTSTYYISPDIYRHYNMPHQRAFVDAVKARGKTAILHMCGHVHGLLDLIKETGCDGIHALTPAPTGDTDWEDALDVLGEHTIIFGCLDPTVFTSGHVSHIGPALDKLITPRLRNAHFVLCPMADGIAVDLARFEAIAEWMRANES